MSSVFWLPYRLALCEIKSWNSQSEQQLGYPRSERDQDQSLATPKKRRPQIDSDTRLLIN